jgi:tetraacyldisaccharide 4'-kinase
VPVPVVSVGNLTAGGTGKTPLVAWLADWFRQRNLNVVLVSRGYKAAKAGQNDEARELAQRLPDVPHLQNADRVAAAQGAVDQHHAQLILLDDAFQHRRIHRDLDIVLVDALQPFGFQHLLPRGLLREPLGELQRADAVGLSRADAVDARTRRSLVEQLRELAPAAVQFAVAHQPAKLVNARGSAQPVQQLAGQPIVAFCGIGNPDGFHHSLASCGYDIAAFRPFPDHHPFAAKDLAELEDWVAGHQRVAAVLCTCKDLVKINVPRIADRPLWALSVDIQFLQGQEQLEARLVTLIRADLR